MRLHCLKCQRSGRIDPARWAGRPGPLWCFHCARPIDLIDVSAWSTWLNGQIERKRSLQAAGELHSRKQSYRESDADIDSDGLAAELAACLLLCPGFVAAWQQRIEQQVGSNRGCDLLAAWTGFGRAVEVKYTKYRDETRGYLLVRPPPWLGPRMAVKFVDDCLYVLVQPLGSGYHLSGWVDQEQFLQRKVENPWGRADGQVECWGVHWSRLEALETLPEPAAINFAVLPRPAEQRQICPADCWYGYSQTHGFVVVNWQDRRNRPDSVARELYALRWRDQVQLRIPMSEWTPPEYETASDYLKGLAETDAEAFRRRLAEVRSVIEDSTYATQYREGMR